MNNMDATVMCLLAWLCVSVCAASTAPSSTSPGFTTEEMNTTTTMASSMSTQLTSTQTIASPASLTASSFTEPTTPRVTPIDPTTTAAITSTAITNESTMVFTDEVVTSSLETTQMSDMTTTESGTPSSTQSTLTSMSSTSILTTPISTTTDSDTTHTASPSSTASVTAILSSTTDDSVSAGVTSTTSADNWGMVAGALVGILLVTIVLSLGVVALIVKVRTGKYPWQLYRVCRKSKDPDDDFYMLPSRFYDTEIDIQEVETVVDKELTTEAPFQEEYEKISGMEVSRCEIAKSPANFAKNRYVDVLPYDETLVVLYSDSGQKEYINANYISSISGHNKTYIACQGPLVRDVPAADTVEAFWLMIWQCGVDIIIMLTSLIETDSFGREILKCSRYWPVSGSSRYGRVTVILEKETVFYDFTVRKLLISLDHSSNSRRVTQFHYTKWRDFSAAPNCGPLLKMRRLIKEENKGRTVPQVVHCSAGVGRTGTYIAIDQLIEEGDRCKSIDIFQYVQRMRRDRMRMVQTWQQYAFIYTTLNEYFLTGETHLPRDKLLQWDKNRDSAHIEQQFKVLEKVKSKLGGQSYATANATLHRNKNRYSTVVPDDQHLLHFPADKNGNSPYFNAVQLEDYQANIGYYATQIPLPNTVEDFWKLVLEFTCSAIVRLQDSPDGTKWVPTWEEPLNIEEQHHVMCKLESIEGSIATKDITIETPEEQVIYENASFAVETNSETDESSYENTPSKHNSIVTEETSVRLFELKGRDCVNGATQACTEQDIYELMMAVKSWKSVNAANGPVVVLCLNGALVSGVYIAASILLDQLLNEDEVDIFQAVKLIRMTRPQFIPSMVQYKFLHDVMAYCAQRTNDSVSI